MDDDQNDASSNPQADEHLPVSGEISDYNGMPSHDNPLLHEKDFDNKDFGESTDDEEVSDPNDLNEISAKHTDNIDEAPDPNGPAHPSATDGE